MDIIKTLIALLTIGIAIYSFVSDDRKKQREKSSSTPPTSGWPREKSISITPSPPSPASPQPPAVPLVKPLAQVLPEEGGRVTSDTQEDFLYEKEEDSPETEDLRNAIIWGEILQRKF